MIISDARRRLVAAVAIASAIVGVGAAVHWHRAGLTLSHYDARGHLVVARRIIDSITPGWQQIGAVWLPLPHLLNAIPVQIDALYRTGASGVAISIASFAATAAALAWIVAETTGSIVGAIAAVLVFGLNPNVLYLQSTPMTEPLLLALTTVGVALLMMDARLTPSVPSTADGDGTAGFSRTAAVVLALACLTRYEAWPVTFAAIALAAFARWRSGWPLRDAVSYANRIAAWPVGAIVAFVIFSRVVVGEWFVASGFFVPENKSLGDVALSAKEIAWGTATLSSTALVWCGAAGAAVLVALGIVDWRRPSAIVAVALTATAAIPLAAFYRGHPFRIRYMVPLIAIEAVGCGVLAGVVRRVEIVTGIAIAALTLSTLRPFDAKAPMVLEAQWDRPNEPVRARVTGCLGPPRDGVKIMASMGSLGHYMQEASAAGYQIRDFLHEGNGDIWLAAVVRPRPFADWILIEEKAEGGDMLAKLARERPQFLDGYARVCEGAGLALYRREPLSAPAGRSPAHQNRNPIVSR